MVIFLRWSPRAQPTSDKFNHAESSRTKQEKVKIKRPALEEMSDSTSAGDDSEGEREVGSEDTWSLAGRRRVACRRHLL